MTYGKCPTCKGDVKFRERKPNGNDRCVNGHIHPSNRTMQQPRKVTPFDVMFGEIIQRARKGKKLSQTALADKIGVTFQQLQKYEKGHNRVPFSRAAVLCRLLGLNLETIADQILHDTGELDRLVAS